MTDPAVDRMKRDGTADLLKGLAVLLMIQVHIMEQFVSSDTYNSLIGKASMFLGGPPCAPVFLAVMGYFLAITAKPFLYFLRVTEQNTDLAFTHKADVLDANHGIFGKQHIVAHADTHTNSRTIQFNGFYFTKFYSIDLYRIINIQCTDLIETQIIAVKFFTGITVV
jgi:hypothetical protein